MIVPLRFHNFFHLGDCLRQVHFQNHVEQPSVLHCRPDYHEELRPFCSPHVKLAGLTQIPTASIDSWIGKDCFHTKNGWEDFVPFLLKWFAHLSKLAQVKCPFSKAEDLLFDNQAILAANNPFPRAEVLLINAQPMSHQWKYNPAFFDRLARGLEKRFNVVTTEYIPGFQCTRMHGLKVVDIAKIAAQVKMVLSIDTGPVIPCFNTFCRPDVWRVIMHITNRFAFPNTVSCHTEHDVIKVLKAQSIISD